MMRTTRPVTVSVTWLLWLTLMAGCGDTPMTPSPPTPSPPPATFTLSGIVYEHTHAGVRPAAGVSLDVFWLGQRPRRITSDAEGRYEVPNLSAGAVRIHADSVDHVQPCRAAIRLAGESVLDLHVVAVAALKASGIPPTFSVLQPTLSGGVFERTPDGMRAVPEAHLTLDFSGIGEVGFLVEPGAQSISDSAGQFFFCNITESGLGISVAKPGYRSAFFLVPANSITYDVELVRE